MGESIRFYEAAEQMKPGDIFRPDDEHFSSFEAIKDEDRVRFDAIGPGPSKHRDKVHFFADFMCLTGKIIRAEPKVLSPEEILEKHKNGYSAQLYHSTVLIMLREARENFRLERDLELRSLVEKVSSLFYPGCNWRIDPDQAKELQSVLENLKPLNQDD